MSSPVSVPTRPIPPSPIRRAHAASLSIDLSDLPPLTTPSNPSNTLLITNLGDPLIFAAPNLQSIRTAIEAQAQLYSFSPLKSFRRIIAVFYSIEAATEIRRMLDGETVLGHRVRVYFGGPIEVDDVRDQHLSAPKADKQFFISPPPSPPGDWSMRNEDPPNKHVHASDLVHALKRIDAVSALLQGQLMDLDPPATPSSATPGTSAHKGRSRSSTVVFDPADHGSDAGLPAIAVEDTSDDDDDDDASSDALMASPVLDQGQEQSRVMTHTSRPPVELMNR